MVSTSPRRSPSASLTPEGGWQLFFSAFFVVSSGWLALTLARITFAYGAERFTTPPPTRFDVDTRMSWSTFLAAQIPGVVLLLRVGWNATFQGRSSVWMVWIVILYFVGGAIAAFVFWLTIAVLYYWTYPPTISDSPDSDSKDLNAGDIRAALVPTAKAFLVPDSKFFHLEKLEELHNPPLGRFVKAILSLAVSLGPGYERQDHDKKYGEQDVKELHSGHAVAIFLFFGYLTLYFSLMGITSPREYPVITWTTRLLVTVIAIVAVWDYLSVRRSTSEAANNETNGSAGVPEPARLSEVDTRSAEVVKAGAKTSTWYRFLPRIVLVLIIAFGVTVFIQHHAHRSFPVLASLFVLLTFGTIVFAGLSFWADHYRIPVITVFLFILILTNLSFLRADHQFDGHPIPAAVPIRTPLSVLHSFGPTPRPLIIVTATGGGIHSAMWTAEVLKALELQMVPTCTEGEPSCHQHSLHDSLLLASTVSGGSVGMMSYLNEYKRMDSDPFDPVLLQDHLVRTSACSSLEAVAWGLIYPDLWRTIFPALFKIPRIAHYDRGFALEKAIRFNLTDPSCSKFRQDNNQNPDYSEGPSLGDYIDGAPAFAFNTTATETGDRFLLGNYQVPMQYESAGEQAVGTSLKDCDTYQSNRHSDLLPAASFLQTFAEQCPGAKHPLADLPLSTAARLSASFTYVSPATRPAESLIPYGYHFVDGGYFDNDGTGSVIEFLDSIARAGGFPENSIQPILLIEIRNGSDTSNDRSPESYSCQSEHCNSPGSSPKPWGPWRQLAAPPEAMYMAGHESITRRNRRELCLLEDELQPRVVLHHAVFPLIDEHGALSWHLTSRQGRYIEQAIKTPQAQAAIKNAVEWFRAAEDGKLPNEEVCQVNSFQN
jgi:hypothetical protein